MKKGTVAMANLRHLGNRLNHPRLVVDVHHRNQNRPIVNRALYRIKVHDPIASNREHLNLETLVPKRPSRLDNRTMFRLDSNNLPSPSGRSRNAEER